MKGRAACIFMAAGLGYAAQAHPSPDESGTIALKVKPTTAPAAARTSAPAALCSHFQASSPSNIIPCSSLHRLDISGPGGTAGSRRRRDDEAGHTLPLTTATSRSSANAVFYVENCAGDNSVGWEPECSISVEPLIFGHLRNG